MPGFGGAGVAGDDSRRFVPVIFRFVIVMFTGTVTDFDVPGSTAVIVHAGAVATVGPLTALTLSVLETAGPLTTVEPLAPALAPLMPMLAPVAQNHATA